MFLFCYAYINGEYQQDQVRTDIDKIISEGWNLKAQGKDNEAILKYEQALNKSKEIDYEKGIGYSSYYLGSILIDSNVTQAAGLCSTALDISMQIKDKELETYSNNLLGKINYLSGDCEKALAAHWKAVELSKLINNVYYEIDSLLCILNIYVYKGNSTGIDKFGETLLNRALKTNDDYVKMKAYSTLGDIYFNLGDNDKAYRLLNNALSISNKIKDKIWKISILAQLGNLYLKQGENEKALKVFQETNEYYIMEINLVRRGFVLNSMGLAFYNLGNYKEANKLLDESLRILKLSKSSLGNLAALMSLCSLYNNMGEYFKAFNLLNEALLVSKEIKYALYDPSILLNLGFVCYKLNKLLESEKYINDAIRSIEKLDSIDLKALNYLDLANFYSNTGNYTKAIDYYNKAKHFSEESNNEDAKGMIYFELAKFYFSQGDLIKAYSYSTKSIDLKTSIKPDQKNVVKIDFLAQLSKVMGDKIKALANQKRALLLSQKIGDKKLEVDCLVGLSEYFLEERNFKIALDYLLEAQQIINDVKDIGSEIMLFEKLSYYYLSLKIYPTAYKYINKAIDLNINSMNRSNLQWDYHILGYILLKMQKDNEALKYFKMSEELRESIKININEKEYVSYYLFRTASVNENIINILNRINERENNKIAVREAFKYAEKGKARLLLDMLGEARYKIKANVQTKEIEEINQYYSKINVIEESYKNANDVKIKRNLMNEIVGVEENLRNLELSAHKSDAKLASILDFEPLDIEYIQKQIIKDQNMGILEYYIGVEKSYIFVITYDNIKLVELEINNYGLTEKIKRLREPFERIKNGSFILDELNKFNYKLANELYAELFSPISSYIKGINRLIIIPHGCLYYMPFEILVSKYSDENTNKAENILSSANCKYLIEDYSISYASSTSVLDERLYNREHKNEFKGDLLAFANPVYREDMSIDNDQITNRNMIIRSFGRDLASLPNSELEVNEIKKYFKKPLIFIGKSATEDNFSKTSPFFQIIHIATHGYLNENSPMYSGLAFSFNDQTNDIDLCNAYEIFNLNLNCDLVVLSACETALGQNIGTIGGEGVEGLTRAFLYAGAKSLVVSLWQAADEPTSMLMSEFYKNYIEKAMDKADALREAKLFLMKQSKKIGNNILPYSSPFFWAPFILIGASN